MTEAPTQTGNRAPGRPSGIKQLLHGIYSGWVNALHRARHTKPAQQRDRQKSITERLKINQCIPKPLRKGSTPAPLAHFTRAQKLEHATRERDIRLSKQATKILTIQERYSRSHTQASVTRMNAIRDRQNLLDSLNFLDESVRSLVDSLGEITSDQSLINDDVGIRLKQTMEDHAQLQVRIAQVREHDQRLLDLDEVADKCNNRLAKATKKLSRLINLADESDHPHDSVYSLSTVESASSRPPSQTPSLLTRFLDSRGNIPIFQERLDDIDVEHAEQNFRREILRDRSEELDPDDEEFEKEYQIARAKILQDLDRAERETSELELACKMQGLDTTFDRRYSTESAEDQPLHSEYVWIPRQVEMHNAQVSDWTHDVSNYVVPENADFAGALPMEAPFARYDDITAPEVNDSVHMPSSFRKCSAP